MKSSFQKLKLTRYTKYIYSSIILNRWNFKVGEINLQLSKAKEIDHSKLIGSGVSLIVYKKIFFKKLIIISFMEFLKQKEKSMKSIFNLLYHY